MTPANGILKKKDLLLIEDNPGDVRLIQFALERLGGDARMFHVSDGDQAIGFLKRTGEWTSAPRPALILLDLNLPRVDGRQILKEIQSDPSLSQIPVFVLSSSDLPDDMAFAERSKIVSRFFTKPASFFDFEKILVQIDQAISQGSC